MSVQARLVEPSIPPRAMVALGVQESRLSSGRVALPTGTQLRWGVVDGSPVDVIDLGFGALVVPHGAGTSLLSHIVPSDDDVALAAS